MQFSVYREQLFPVLSSLIGIVEKRKTLPILSTILFEIENNTAVLTATDMEIQVVDSVQLENSVTEKIRFAVPGRKLFDIVRVLADDECLNITLDNEKLTIHVDRSKFLLYILPATDFPVISAVPPEGEWTMPTHLWRQLLETTGYAVADQEVRFFLNGVLIDVQGNQIVAVGSDGHRMACVRLEQSFNVPPTKFILPRKTVTEMLRLLPPGDQSTVALSYNQHHVFLHLAQLALTTTLIDANYPDYRWLFNPHITHQITVEKQTLKQLLVRVAVMSTDKFAGVWLLFKPQQLVMITTNQEHESAEDAIEVAYNGDAFETAFNIHYLVEAIGMIAAEKLTLSFQEANGPLFLSGEDQPESVHVLMPVRM